MSKKKEVPVVNPEAPSRSDVIPPMKPGDELQIYYNDAYMREKQRLNKIFGVIPEDKPAVREERIIEPDMSEYVTVKQFKKQKRRTAVLAVFTVLFGIAAAIFAILYFVK